MSRLSVLFLAAATLTGINIAAEKSASAYTLYAQYYPPGYSSPPPGYRPPCNAVTPGPLRAREEARLEARSSGRYQAMPGAALRLAPASVLSAVQFVRVRPAAQVPVIEAMTGCQDRKRHGHKPKP
jgi:hypothetical protein